MRQPTALPRKRMSRRRRAAAAPRPAGHSRAHLLCKRAHIQRQHEVGDVGLPGARGQLLGHCGGRRSLPAPAQGQQHEAHQRRLDHRHAGGPPGPLPVLLLGHSSVAGRLPGCWAPRHPGAAAASSGRLHQIAGDGRRPQQVRPAHQSKRVCAVYATPPACKALGAGRDRRAMRDCGRRGSRRAWGWRQPQRRQRTARRRLPCRCCCAQHTRAAAIFQGPH